MDEDVLQLDVAMKNAFAVEVVENLEQLPRQLLDHLFWVDQLTFVLFFNDIMVKVT